jgi:hypothetical protein
MFFTHNVGVPTVFGVDPRALATTTTGFGIDPRFAFTNNILGGSLVDARLGLTNTVVDPRVIAATCGIDARNCDPRVLAACGLTPQSINVLCSVAPHAVQPFVASCVAQACNPSTAINLNSTFVDPRVLAAGCGIDARNCDPRVLAACGLNSQTLSILNTVAPQAVQTFVANCVAQACNGNILPNTAFGINTEYNSFPGVFGMPTPVNTLTGTCIPTTPTTVIPSVRTFSPAQPVGFSSIPTTQATVIF